MALLRHCLRELREMRHDWNVPADAWPEADLRWFALDGIDLHLDRSPSPRPEDPHRVLADARNAAN